MRIIILFIIVITFPTCQIFNKISRNNGLSIVMIEGICINKFIITDEYCVPTQSFFVSDDAEIAELSEIQELRYSEIKNYFAKHLKTNEIERINKSQNVHFLPRLGVKEDLILPSTCDTCYLEQADTNALLSACIIKGWAVKVDVGKHPELSDTLNVIDKKYIKKTRYKYYLYQINQPYKHIEANHVKKLKLLAVYNKTFKILHFYK